MIAACIALLISSLIAAFLPEGELDDQAIEGLGVLTVYVWLYCLIWFLIQDVFKVASYKFLRRFQIFGYGAPFVMAGASEEHEPLKPPAPTVVIHH